MPSQNLVRESSKRTRTAFLFCDERKKHKKSLQPLSLQNKDPRLGVFVNISSETGDAMFIDWGICKCTQSHFRLGQFLKTPSLIFYTFIMHVISQKPCGQMTQIA